MAVPKTVITVTIPAGQAVSSAADLTGVYVTALLAPADWSSPAVISFLVSPDDVPADYRDLFDVSGSEIVRAIGANRGVIVDPAMTSGAMFLKIRSGPRDNPVVQAVDRVFTLIVQG